jgi:HD-GYP domain-containing protein (c-di-GMP phosphodiesterase class II)
MQLALRVAILEAQKHLKVDTAIVMLFNPDLQWLETEACQGVHSSASFRLKIGQGIMGKTALERRTMLFPNLDKEPPSFLSPLETHGKLKSFFSMPLIVRGNLLGVFGAGFLSPFTPGQEWMDFFNNLANQISMGIDTIKSLETLSRTNAELTLAYDTTIMGWSRAMSLRDKETFEHTDRVVEITIQIALIMGISKEMLLHVRRGAILHDIGKMGIPDGILLKPHELTPEEWEIMRKHPVYAYEMLQPIAYLRPALDIPYCHHEKWDGSGYPRGLKGEEIPLAARIFSVVDVWDALRFDRPYRKRWSDKKIMEYIRSESGKYFDPQIVDVFIHVIGERN